MAFCVDARDNRLVRQWTIRILICLLLGAITTVAVAWETHYWPYDGNHDSGVRGYWGTAGSMNTVERGTIVIPISAGWPALAIFGIGGTRPVPLWPGFVIDTLFYGAIWFGVFFGFTSAKRFIRVRRGRCPRCGYDLRGQSAQGCPECGWNREERQLVQFSKERGRSR